MGGQKLGEAPALPTLGDVESTRRYDQPCPLATALDVLGTRWTMLIVRELLLGPKRFGDLQRRLPGIGPNRLSQRLRDLQDTNIVAHEESLYRLTEYGEGLRKPLVGMALWGFNLMIDSLDIETVRADMVALFLVESATPAGVGDLSTRCEIRFGEEVMTLDAADRQLQVHSGPTDSPAAVVTCSNATFVALATGSLAVDDAVATGAAEVSGATEDVRRLVDVLAATAAQLLARLT